MNRARFMRFLLPALLAALLLAGCQREEDPLLTSYDQAERLLQAGDFTQAAADFDGLGHYRAAPEYALYSRGLSAAKAGDFDQAASTMRALDGFMESQVLAVYYEGRSLEAQARYEQAGERYAQIAQYGDAATRMAALPELMLARDYAAAEALAQEGRPEAALAAFEALGDYSDSAAKAQAQREAIQARDYAAAEALETSGDYDGAKQAFEALGDYADSAARAKGCVYRQAERLEAQGQSGEAMALFIGLDGYEDSQARAFALAEALERADDVVAARRGFAALGDYEGAAERAAAIAREADYREAFALAEEGRYDEARRRYLALEDYQDAAERARLLGVFALAGDSRRLNPGVYAFELDGLWGFVDLDQGRDVAPAWEDIGPFSEATGLAVVRSDERCALADRQGRALFPCVFDDIAEGENGFYTGAYQSGNVHTFYFIDDAFIQAMNEGGHVTGYVTLGESRNTDADSKYNNRRVLRGPTFPNGVMLAQEQRGGGWAAFTADGERRLSGAEAIEPTATGDAGIDALWVTLDGDRLYGLSCEPLSDAAWQAHGAFSEGLCAVKNADGLWGYVAADGSVAIEPQYAAATEFSEGLAAVADADGLWSYIDGDNQMVIPAKYARAGAFESGLAKVSPDGAALQVIDAQGALVYFKQSAYLDADAQAQRGEYEASIAAFEALDGYADSDERALEVRERINADVYAQAEALESEGSHEEAAKVFRWLGDYRDAAKRAEQNEEAVLAGVYAQAKALEDGGELEKAIEVYRSLGEYRQSAKHADDLREGINQGILAEAEALAGEGRFEAAIDCLSQIPEYGDAQTRIEALREKIHQRDYDAAAALEDAGKFEQAIDAFAAMNGWSDADARIEALKEKILKRDYDAAAALEDAGKLEQAIDAFAAMDGWSDADARIEALREKILKRDYDAAAALEEGGSYAEAYDAFLALGDYADSAERASLVMDKAVEQQRMNDYQAAEALEEAGELEKAAAAFEALGDYSDSAERLAQVKESILLRDYQAAEALEKAGDADGAIAAFAALGDYSDSAERIEAIRERQRKAAYDQAVADLAAGGYREAAAGFGALGDYLDSAQKLETAATGVRYLDAVDLALAGQLDEAYQAFAALGDFADSAQKASIVGNLSHSDKTTQIADGVLIYEFHELWGIANLNENVITPAKYDSIECDEASNYRKLGLLKVFVVGGEADRGDWSNEVHMDDVYGYIDLKGTEVIPCKYFMVSDFDAKGRCTVGMIAKQKDNSYYSLTLYMNRLKFGILDSEGRVVTEPQWRTMGSSRNKYWDRSDYPNEFTQSDYEVNPPAFTDGRMMVQNAAGSWGFIDETGAVLGEVKWASIGAFSDGMAMVSQQVDKQTLYGFIDESGQVVGEVQWDAVNAFSNGYAAVLKGGKWGFIDHSNTLVIPCAYLEVSEFGPDGTCDVKTADGTWQIIDTTGSVSFFGSN